MESSPVDQSNSSTQKSNHKNILGVLLAILLVLAIACGVYLWQQHKVEGVNKQLEAEKSAYKSLQEQNDIFAGLIVASPGVTNTEDESKIAAGNEVQEIPYQFYLKLLKMGERTDTKLNPLLNEYLTANAIKQVKAPSSYDLLTCGQSRRNYFYMGGNPVIQGDQATMDVKTAYVGFNPDLIHLKLVKQNGKWMINSLSCTIN